MRPADPAPGGNDAAAVARMLADAVLMAQVHTGEDGWCRGCFEVWARLAPFPCGHATWALSVLARHGDQTPNQPEEAR